MHHILKAIQNVGHYIARVQIQPLLTFIDMITSPVMEKTPQTFALMHAAENMSVSGPGIVDAVSNISCLSYIMPWVEYSGKITKSIPGNPDCIDRGSASLERYQGRSSGFLVLLFIAYLHANEHFTDILCISKNFRWVMESWHFIVDNCDSNGVIAARDISCSWHTYLDVGVADLMKCDR